MFPVPHVVEQSFAVHKIPGHDYILQCIVNQTYNVSVFLVSHDVEQGL